jgi:hypothetical protein
VVRNKGVMRRREAKAERRGGERSKRMGSEKQEKRNIATMKV